MVDPWGTGGSRGEGEKPKIKQIVKKNWGKVSVISYVYFLFIYCFLLIDVFFDVDSKSTIGFC